jgi:dTDP-D-glucose 4,6-dehydratase
MPFDDELFSGANVLITGGLGFIGSSFARQLVALRANVTLIDSLIPEYGGNLFNIHDIRDKVSIELTDVRDTKAMATPIKKRDFLLMLPVGQATSIR